MSHNRVPEFVGGIAVSHPCRCRPAFGHTTYAAACRGPRSPSRDAHQCRPEVAAFYAWPMNRAAQWQASITPVGSATERHAQSANTHAGPSTTARDTLGRTRTQRITQLAHTRLVQYRPRHAGKTCRAIRRIARGWLHVDLRAYPPIRSQWQACRSDVSSIDAADTKLSCRFSHMAEVGHNCPMRTHDSSSIPCSTTHELIESILAKILAGTSKRRLPPSRLLARSKLTMNLLSNEEQCKG